MFIVSVLLLFLQAQPQQAQPQPFNPPSAQDTLSYLNQTIDWYRHLSVEEGIAGDSADIRFVNDDRQIAKQVLQLSFEFARSNAKLLTGKNAPAVTNESEEPQRNRGLSRAAATAEAQVKTATAELETLRQKLATATKTQRAKLQTTIDEVQAELNLAQTRSDTFRSILQFVGEGGEAGTRASLATQIDELQRSIPELEPEPKAGAAQTSNSGAPNQSAAAGQTTSHGSPSGILDLITDLFALSRKMRTIDQTMDLTNALTKSL